MKLNNKGMSLIELLVSIVLISIILIFLFQLVMDMNSETESNNYAYNNQINRTEAIYTVEKDLNKYTLIGIEDASYKDENDIKKIKIIFHYEDGKDAVLNTDYVINTTSNNIGGELDSTKYYLRYTAVDGVKYSWEMKGAEIDPCGFFKYYNDSLSNKYYFKLNIYIYNYINNEENNKSKNNAVDDIEITYAGDNDDLITANSNYLTRNTQVNKNIGVCTN